MAQIPELLQLCAEQVAAQTTNNKKLRKYLKRMQLPEVRISYIKYDKFHKSCDFSKFMKRNMTNTTIIPSMPKWSENIDVKITVGNEQLLYISTISDLGKSMLKLDIPTGEYGLCAFDKGYVLKMKIYHPVKISDAVQVFNTRDGNKGLSGTYHNGETDNIHHLRIFNQYISEFVNDSCFWREYNESFDWWEEHDEYRLRKNIRVLVDNLHCYHNIPVLFYLTTLIELKDLSKITLSCAFITKDCGNIEVCWYVYHSVKGKIGIAVKQKEFFNMMGDQAGICLLVSNGFRALGNFDLYVEDEGADEWVFHPDHDYRCEFDPCFCDTMYEERLKRKILAKKRLQEYYNSKKSTDE